VRYASNLRGEILNAIGRSTFNYTAYFPASDNAARFGFVVSDATVGTKLREHLKIARLAPSTRLTYLRVCERYLYPWFDRTRLRDLTAPMIRAKVLAVRTGEGPGEKAVTLKTARNILAPLGAMLETAVGDGELDLNPLAAVKLERFWPEARVTSDFEADPFAWSELAAIFAACDGGEMGEEADYWRFAVGTGLRPSEQIELHWARCDLVQYRVAVEVARVTSRAETGPLRNGSAVKAPKTRAGRRLVDFTVGAWDALQRQQARTRLAGAHVWRDVRYGAPWRNEEALRKRWMTILKRAGVRYRNPYQTRHTYASTLLAAGFDARWVARQMGHTTTKMLETRYGKWIRQGAEDRQALAAFFSHASPTVAGEASYWRATP
jgi:integrase